MSERVLVLSVCFTVIGGLTLGLVTTNLIDWWRGHRARRHALRRGGYIR